MGRQQKQWCRSRYAVDSSRCTCSAMPRVRAVGTEKERTRWFLAAAADMADAQKGNRAKRRDLRRWVESGPKEALYRVFIRSAFKWIFQKISGNQNIVSSFFQVWSQEKHFLVLCHVQKSWNLRWLVTSDVPYLSKYCTDSLSCFIMQKLSLRLNGSLVLSCKAMSECGSHIQRIQERWLSYSKSRMTKTTPHSGRWLVSEEVVSSRPASHETAGQRLL